MSLNIQQKNYACDVLVVGGGIGGLMAAIRAAEKGASVIVAEKADTRRSGSGATGNDHFLCYSPAYHGENMEPIVKEVITSLYGRWQDISLVRKFLARSFDVVNDWESYGINMRPKGGWLFQGHALPGRPVFHLKYDGREQKPLLTKKARSLGVTILNKLPICDLLQNPDGSVCGAVGLSIAHEHNTPELVPIAAKAVILTAGNASRLYPGVNPAYLFNVAHSPANTGSGQAMAFRAGAKLINLEIPYTHAGPKFFARCGKATWIGVLRDYKQKTVGPFITKPTRELGDITSDIWNSVFREKMNNGTGPSLMDCTKTAAEDLDYMRWGFACEGDSSLVDALDKTGIDLSKQMVEFTAYEPMFIGRGIEVDENGASCVPGLYAAGDLVGNFRADIAGAAVFGVFAAEHAAEYIKQNTLPNTGQSPSVAECAEELETFLARKTGAHWKEANSLLQQVMHDYAGLEVRSESLLSTGLEYLRKLEKRCRAELRAANAHELMRCLEVLDLIQLGQLLMHCALERKESRGLHKRADYTFTNPLLDDMFLTIQQNTSQSVKTAFRERT